LVNRVGVRVYLAVGPGGAPAAAFAIGTLTTGRSRTGAPIVTARVRNTGRETFAITGTLRLTNGPGGLRAGPYPANLATPVSPNHTMPIVMQLDPQLPRGPWRAHIQLAAGPIHHTATQTISFPRAGIAARPSTSPDARDWRYRYAILAGVLASFAGWMLLHLRYRRLR
jgi:hypothetical protein